MLKPGDVAKIRVAAYTLTLPVGTLEKYQRALQEIVELEAVTSSQVEYVAAGILKEKIAEKAVQIARAALADE